MSQTIDHVTFRNVKVELSTDGGSTWLNVSGSTSSITVKDGERVDNQIKPIFGDTTKSYPGRRARTTLIVKSVYTENPAEINSMLFSAYVTNNEIGFRWSPAGGESGSARYRAVDAHVKRAGYPANEVSDPKPLLTEYEITAEEIKKETN